MEVTDVTEVLRELVNVVIRVSAPLLLLSMLVGILVAILQAVTQIHEQSLNFVLKLIVVGTCLVLGGGWMLQTMQEFTRYVFSLM